MSRYFPLFVSLEGKKVLVYGAGAIGSRRVLALLEFGCELTVVAPKASSEIQRLSKGGLLAWRQEEYHPGEILRDTYLVLAATNNREINEQIGLECKKKQIPVNVSSDKELCDFYFPGLATKDELVVGVTASGRNHKQVRAASEEIRRVVERLYIGENESRKGSWNDIRGKERFNGCDGVK
ncbi:bifunctional precorrin-2 dehydrogenase/sirohydrochlorin ferrochelatase [Candidatus Merdisoma sp. JLR.KK006]|uniref:precorrin-2 dehydrogenase/sirohydrochlorin ferrochelatase family protein n=1 Tax=Candidatus Merdisoma sp. JLR.KK006 TaxID=3112626 RepID=UPI002FF01E52